MYTLRDKIFGFFGVYDKVTDVNKNSQGKGTMERYTETLAKFIDDEVSPLVDELPANVIDPFTAYNKYLIYLEEEKGVQMTLYNTDMDRWRRKTLRNIHRWNEIRGTKKAYEVLLKTLGFTSVTIDEPFGSYGLDSPLTFDHTERRFDQRCKGCSNYSLALLGSMTVTDDLINAVREVVAYNQPINAKLTGISLNGSPLIDNLTITIQIDANGDLIFINPHDYSFNAYIDSNGDLIFDSDFASFYSIDGSGNLIFTS